MSINWYSINITIEGENSNIFNGYFSVNANTNVVQSFYETINGVTDFNNNILAPTIVLPLNIWVPADNIFNPNLNSFTYNGINLNSFSYFRNQGNNSQYYSLAFSNEVWFTSSPLIIIPVTMTFNLTSDPTLVLFPICFPFGTPVQTDQGSIAIEKINSSVNTIRGKNIVAITKTITIEDKIVCIEKDALGPNIPSQKTYISRNHELLYNKQMIKAKNLIGQVDGVYNKKYNGEILYNVLLDKHDKMIVNNLIVETLDPENIVAKLYNGNYSVEEKNNIIVNLNNGANEYKKQFGKMR